MGKAWWSEEKGGRVGQGITGQNCSNNASSSKRLTIARRSQVGAKGPRKESQEKQVDG